jgi:hypothetical protein
MKVGLKKGNQTNPGNHVVSDPGLLALRPALSSSLPFLPYLFLIGIVRKRLLE